MSRRRHGRGMELCAPTPAQARQVGNPDVIDEHSELWHVCLHESAHAEAGYEYGWLVSMPRIFGQRTEANAGAGSTGIPRPGSGNGDSGDIGGGVYVELTPAMERRLCQEEYPRDIFLQDAVISMVGPVMSETLFYKTPGGCEADLENARSIMRGTDITTTEVRIEAKRVIHVRRGRIERLAKSLYRKYVKKFAVKEYAS